MSKIIKSIIQLRRDNDYNFEPIKNTFIPANGEVVLVDTATDGLRAKIGDGVTPYNGLIWADAAYRDMLIHGFYKDGIFYSDNSYELPIAANTSKLYIDSGHNSVYYYDGLKYIAITDGISRASAETPGIVKLYETTGQNTDGTMTQKAITDELNLRYKVSYDANEEVLILF